MPSPSTLTPRTSRLARLPGLPQLSRPVAFWTLGATLVFLLFASSAPSPLYVIYQQKWDFSAITLTSVFAVYVVALLAALLFTGSLSDRVGRRPTLVLALLIQAAGMGLFALANGVEALFAARIVQGLATGVATGAISAALIDLQPHGRPHLGALVSSAAPPIGLASGALGSGLLAEYGPDPLGLIFWLLLGVFVVGILAVLAMPETVASRGGWLGALRPRIGVPHASRSTFLTAGPVLVATWALGGLYLSLGPSLAVSLLHTTSHVTGALVIVALAATGALISILSRGHLPQHTMIAGALLLATGVGITLVGLNEQSTAVFFAGSVVAGSGFGAGFSGAFKSIMMTAPPTARAGLVAAMFVLAYLAFSLPAIAAGIAATHEGLLHTTNVYGAVVAVLALWATGATLLRHRRASAAVPAPATS
jgi:MFS family permease